MSGNSAGRRDCDAHSMINTARSLQRAANELEKNGHETGFSDQWLFEGIILARPILLSLAIEIALKAWQCTEREEPPDRTHDLLDLFKSLNQATQEMLEARMRNVSHWSVNAEQPGMREASRDVQDMFLARTHPLHDVLSEHRDANVRWRFPYEHHWDKFETSEIDAALTLIIDAYDERRWF